MRSSRTSEATVQALVGFAAGEGGGIVYARLTDESAKRVIRVEFRIGPVQRSAPHGVAYAALTAVARALVRRGIARANFILSDTDFVREVSTGRGVGEMLALPYVRLRCALNSLSQFSIASGPTDDLTQRARAEAALNVAA
jgi:hypothetical protein